MGGAEREGAAEPGLFSSTHLDLTVELPVAGIGKRWEEGQGGGWAWGLHRAALGPRRGRVISK